MTQGGSGWGCRENQEAAPAGPGTPAPLLWDGPASDAQAAVKDRTDEDPAAPKPPRPRVRRDKEEQTHSSEERAAGELRGAAEGAAGEGDAREASGRRWPLSRGLKVWKEPAVPELGKEGQAGAKALEAQRRWKPEEARGGPASRALTREGESASHSSGKSGPGQIR